MHLPDFVINNIMLLQNRKEKWEICHLNKYTMSFNQNKFYESF